MNTRAEIALEGFCVRLDDFLVACHELEASGKWDIDTHGYMAAYFQSDLFAVLLQIMSADGVFERTEADVLNRMLSSSYTPRELSSMYKSLGPVVDDYCDDEAPDAVELLAKIDEKMCEEYRGLILDACNIVSLADGVAERDERALIEKLRIALER